MFYLRHDCQTGETFFLYRYDFEVELEICGDECRKTLSAMCSMSSAQELYVSSASDLLTFFSD